MTPLSNWLVEQPKQVVAIQVGETKTTEDLLKRVSCWLRFLSGKQGKRWALYHSDAFEFLAILLALWQLEKLACVPGDNCEGTVAQLRDHVDGFIGDFPEGLEIDDCEAEIESVNWRKINPNAIAVEIYTSGSTGDPKAIIKTISQLELELETLEKQWPTEEGVVLTTVSHQHLYGMTFRLLWPFSSGIPFARQLCEYSEDIFHHAHYYPKFSVVSSPSHLSRINTTVNWAELSGHCQHIISSAAPLKKQDSIVISELFNAPVREIYGSSETGVIAWRTQQEKVDKALWNALPYVGLTSSLDDRLSVISPYLGQQEALVLSDRVAFNKSGGFELKGRVDTIVKVEGKRVSLTAMEKLLINNSWAKEVKALTLNRNRMETAIVMCLTAEGEAQLMLLGRRAFITQFKNDLSHHFESTVLPRRWRFVDQMPYNAQGKLPLKAMQLLFDQHPVVKWPKIRSIDINDSRVEIQCNVPRDLLYFEGHFDNRSILPGVTQVYWAEKLAWQLLPVKGRFKRLEVIKFLQIIEPNDEVVINLEYNATKKTLLFKYQSEKGLHSSGRICFG